MAEEPIKLTKLTRCAGCGAKVGAGVLAQLLEGIRVHHDPNLLVGFDKSDDASVYKISDQLALVQTVDFFPPIADDPYLFGQIAATNALSDVYAMGGEPMRCTIDGVLRGILPSGTPVHKGMKSGDVDPRCQPEYCTTVSDKALAVGGGVLEAILHLSGALDQI